MKFYYLNKKPDEQKARHGFFDRLKYAKFSGVAIVGINLVMFFMLMSVLDGFKIKAITITNENIMAIINKWNGTTDSLFYMIFMLLLVFLWKCMVISHEKKPQGALRGGGK
jgi:hypothetical protein